MVSLLIGLLIIRVVLIVIAVLWLLSALFGISTPGLRLNG
jgi:hypothetical protein